MIRWLFYSSQIADIMFEIDPAKRCPTLTMDLSFQFLNLLGHKAINCAQYPCNQEAKCFSLNNTSLNVKTTRYFELDHDHKTRVAK